MERNTLYISLLSGPGVGKSTTAAGVFSLLKLHGVDCELVTEYAKELTWKKDFETLSMQDHVLEEQAERMERLRGQVDVVISDTALLFSVIYRPESFGQDFYDKVIERINRFNNLNVFINRVKPYNPNGRNQTEEEARKIDLKVKLELKNNNMPYIELPGDFTGINKLSEIILNKLDIKGEYFMDRYVMPNA